MGGQGRESLPPRLSPWIEQRFGCECKTINIWSYLFISENEYVHMFRCPKHFRTFFGVCVCGLLQSRNVLYSNGLQAVFWSTMWVFQNLSWASFGNLHCKCSMCIGKFPGALEQDGGNLWSASIVRRPHLALARLLWPSHFSLPCAWCHIWGR